MPRELQSMRLRRWELKYGRKDNNVIIAQLLGLCYDNLGDRKRAEECMRYVLEYGNTMPARAKAEEWLAHDSKQSESKGTDPLTGKLAHMGK